MLCLLFYSGKLLPFAFAFGSQRCDGGCCAAVDEEESVGNTKVVLVRNQKEVDLLEQED